MKENPKSSFWVEGFHKSEASVLSAVEINDLTDMDIYAAWDFHANWDHESKAIVMFIICCSK